MTRATIEQEYKIESGIIRTPGQFEGEMLYVPYFWDAYLNGFADQDDGNVLYFVVTDDDKIQFPELKRRKVIRLYQREDGFVCEAR